MTDGIDPRLITGACSMVSWSAWGLHGNVVQLVRLVTIDNPADWAELGRSKVANWLNTQPRHARRLLDDLVASRVLERLPGKGSRGGWYRFRDPRDWRGVPWRFEGSALDSRPPEIVRHRLAVLLESTARSKSPVVARYSAQQNRFAARPQHPPKDPLLRAPSAQQIDGYLRAPSAQQIGVEPSSRPPEPTGSTSASGGEEEEARRAPGDVELTGAAKAVAEAIVLTGAGPVKGRLRKRLAAAFEGVAEERLRPITEAMARAALGGQLPPAMVTLACDMLAAGAAAEPAKTGIQVARRLAELHDHAEALRRDLREAQAEGDDVASIFEEQLARCETEIQQLGQRRAG